MIKITNEIDGKLYELVPKKVTCHPCKGCAFETNKDADCSMRLGKDTFNNVCLCGVLRGIWKEVKNEKTN